MRALYGMMFFLFSIGALSQEPILLDTLQAHEKKRIKQIYDKRRASFLTDLSREASSKKEIKEVSAIFEENYTNLYEKIDKNRVLLESPLNDYLNELLRSVQKENPEIPDDISLLVARDYAVNAFNRGEGTVIINNYLLHALDHEDQLVYILCHELAHQTLGHVLKSVKKYVQANNSTALKTQTKQLKKQRYQRKTKAADALLEIAYKNSAENRAKEIQADSLGYVFYSRLNRSPQQVAKTLALLRDSDMESDSLTVKDYNKLFASFGLKANEEWFEMESFTQYNYQKHTRFNTDSLRTHPNCDVRIAHLTSFAPEIKHTANAGRSSETFEKWKQSAVYQNILNEYYNQNYGNSLYEALKLYNRKPDPLLKQWIGWNFTKLFEAKKAYELNKYVSQVNVVKYTRSYNLFSTFIFNLNLTDLETICKNLST